MNDSSYKYPSCVSVSSLISSWLFDSNKHTNAIGQNHHTVSIPVLLAKKSSYAVIKQIPM